MYGIKAVTTAMSLSLSLPIFTFPCMCAFTCGSSPPIDMRYTKVSNSLNFKSSPVRVVVAKAIAT